MIALSLMPRGSGGWIGARCVRAGATGKTLHGDRGIMGGAGCPHANGRRGSVCHVHGPAFHGWGKNSKAGLQGARVIA